MLVTPLETAIQLLQAEVDAYGIGTSLQPDENTSDWYILRAKSVGLSCLKQMLVTGLTDDPKRSEAFYRANLKGMKQPDMLAEADRAVAAAASLVPEKV